MNSRRRPLLAALAAVAAVLALAACGGDAGEVPEPPVLPSGVVAVDLIYLDHPPVQPVIQDVDRVLAEYEGKVAVVRHDAESAEGEALAQSLGLTDHVPVAVAIDRAVQVDVGGRSVRFEGFPAGRAPVESAQGSWTIEDLAAALAQRTR